MQICGRQIIYRKYFLASIVLRLLQLAELFHEALGADCGVDLGHERQLRLAAVAGRDCAAVDEKGNFIETSNDRRKELKVINDNCAIFHAPCLI